jgi:hypothetical protein
MMPAEPSVTGGARSTFARTGIRPEGDTFVEENSP